jgi:hypothetical protein
MKFLLANGCSHTAGADIIPPGGFKAGQEAGDPDEAWPRWVARHFNIFNVNIAKSGSGNEQISRSTIMYVSEMLEFKKVDPKDFMVCIMWSGFDRYEYWCPDKQAHRSGNLSMTVFAENFRQYLHSHRMSKLVREYITYRSLIETEQYSNYKNLYHMYITATFLESKGIEYYFSNGVNRFTSINKIKENNLKKLYSDMLSLYGGNRIRRHLGFDDRSLVFSEFLKNKGIPYSPHGNKSHWGTDGQKEYAKLFIKHIEDNR